MLNKFLISSLFVTSSWIVLSDARAMREEDAGCFKITAPQLSEGLEKKKIKFNGKVFIILSKFDLGSAKQFCEKNPKKTFTAIKKDENTFKLSYIKEKSAIFKLTFQKKNDDIVHEGRNSDKDYKNHAGFKKSIEEYTKRKPYSTRNEDTKNDNMTPYDALKKHHESLSSEWLSKNGNVQSYMSYINEKYYKYEIQQGGFSIIKKVSHRSITFLLAVSFWM